MREAILAAAEELFATNGFNAVSVRDIALAAGANPGSVTYHFKTKDGLLLEIYRRHCGPMNLRRSSCSPPPSACAISRTGWKRSCAPMCSRPLPRAAIWPAAGRGSRGCAR